MSAHRMRPIGFLAMTLICLAFGSAVLATTTPQGNTRAQQPVAQPASTAAQEPAPTASQPAEKEVKPFTLSPERYEKAVAYSRASYILYFAGVVYGVAILLLVLYRGWAVRIRDLSERVSRFRFVQALVFTPLLLLTMDALGLPLSVAGLVCLPKIPPRPVDIATP